LSKKCYVVDSLPRSLYIILGQDWFEKAGYGFHKKTPVIILPYSEQVMKCKTCGKGIPFIEHQLLQPGLIAASSLVECKANDFLCLVINLTDKPISMVTNPRIERSPTIIRGQYSKNPTSMSNMKILQVLREKN
jgi:hypothetical protein